MWPVAFFLEAADWLVDAVAATLAYPEQDQPDRSDPDTRDARAAQPGKRNEPERQ